MTKIINLTRRPVELSTGQLLTPAGGEQDSNGREVGGVVEGFTVTQHERDLAAAGKVALVDEPSDETVDDLRRRAAELDIDGRSKMNRDELVAAIADAENNGGES